MRETGGTCGIAGAAIGGCAMGIGGADGKPDIGCGIPPDCGSCCACAGCEPEGGGADGGRGGMCIGCVVGEPGGGGGGGAKGACDGAPPEIGGGGGADRIDCDAGGPDLNVALGGGAPFACPRFAKAPESVLGGGGIPAAGTGGADVRGGELRMASMSARSGSVGAAAFSLSLLSLSKTCVASSSSSQSMSSWRPFWLDVAAAGAAAVGRVLGGCGSGGGEDFWALGAAEIGGWL
jgi:hypothetical protein